MKCKECHMTAMKCNPFKCHKFHHTFGVPLHIIHGVYWCKHPLPLCGPQQGSQLPDFPLGFHRKVYLSFTLSISSEWMELPSWFL